MAVTMDGRGVETAVRERYAEGATRVAPDLCWSVRQPEPTWRGIADDPLPGRRELVEAAAELASGAGSPIELRPGTAVNALEPDGRGVRVGLLRNDGSEVVVEADRILSLTG